MKSFVRFLVSTFARAGFAVAAACIACGCSRHSPALQAQVQADESDSKILLGFSQIGAESAWRTYNSKSVQDAAEAAGIQLLFSNAEQKQENQIKAIRSFIVYRVDVIAFVPIVQDGWDNVLREAKAAHIPVIVCDRKLHTSDESLYAAYIGTDSIAEGLSAARFLQQKFEKSTKPVNILELRGTDGSSASDERIQGFHTGLESITDGARFRIIYSESGNFMRSRGREIAQNLLSDSVEGLCIDGLPVDVIFSANDAMTLGFLEVLSSHGIATGPVARKLQQAPVSNEPDADAPQNTPDTLEAGSGITIITVDAQQEAMDKLRAGDINCVIECNPDIGPNIMATAKRLAQGKSVPKLVHVEERVFSEFDDTTPAEPRGY